MNTSQDIWNEAKRSTQTYRDITAIKSDGTYNTTFMLSHEHIKAAALVRIAELKDITFDEASKKCFIDGISIQDVTNITTNQIGEFFSNSIQNAVDNTISRKQPSFLSIDDAHHFILIGLLPTNIPNEVIVTYNNSIPYEKEHLRRDTGRTFALQLVNYLKEISGINIYNNNYIDLSQDQQYDNCCGLSVADNIAAITSNFVIGQSTIELTEHLFQPSSKQEKEDYYKKFGRTFFQKLNEQNPSIFTFLDGSESILEELVRKYKSRLGNNTDNTPKDNVINEFFTESKTKLTLLNIYPCENLENIQIPAFKVKTNSTYFRIGEENSNNLTMAQTADNKIYFDESKNNKFTGLVFVERMDPKSNTNLDSKDIIIYKNGKIVDFYEGEQGISRLGQLSKLQAASIGKNVTSGISASSSDNFKSKFQYNSQETAKGKIR